MPRMQEALARLAEAGFDIAHDFDTRAFATLLPPGHGVLIGNTGALWPCFEAARRDEPDPLERYTERSIEGAFPHARVFYVHRQYGGAFLPFQRIAVATGLGALAPSRLVVHPTYGPWFALRAIVVVDGIGPARVPIPQPCTCETRCTAALDAALANPGDARGWIAVRDACSIAAHRYGDAQLRYHYNAAFPGAAMPHDGGRAPSKPR